MPEKKLAMLAFQCDHNMHRDVRIQAAKEGKSLREFLTNAVDKALDESHRRELEAKKAGVGGHRSARAIRKLTADQKSKMARDADDI